MQKIFFYQECVAQENTYVFKKTILSYIMIKGDAT